MCFKSLFPLAKSTIIQKSGSVTSALDTDQHNEKTEFASI